MVWSVSNRSSRSIFKRRHCCIVSVVNATDFDIKNIKVKEVNLADYIVLNNRSRVVLGNIRTEHLGKEEKDSLSDIVQKNSDIFYIENEKLSKTLAIKHMIRTLNFSAPIFTKTYRYPKIHDEEVRKQISTLDGIISLSLCSSPLWRSEKKSCLKNAPACFQRLLNALLSGLQVHRFLDKI